MLIIIAVLLITTYSPNAGLSSPHGNDNKQPVFGIFYNMELIITNRKGQTFSVLYDEIDRDTISKYTWHINQEIKPYAKTRIRDKNGAIVYLYMHRLILGLSSNDMKVDHKNRNRLDNRRSNLRICTDSQNSKNTSPRGVSKYLGVIRHIQVYELRRTTGTSIYTKWVAQIKINGKHKYLGAFTDEIEAAKKYDSWAKIHHGEFANLNFPDE